MPEQPPPNALPADALPAHSDTVSPTDIVRGIHAGRRNVEDLSPDLRLQCVVHLTDDGFSTREIAELMHISERTVRRDRAAVRRHDAMAPDMRLGDELLGEFHRLTLASIARLTRMARQHDTPPYARLGAEEAINRMYARLIRTARHLGYIESGADRLAHQRATDPAEVARREQTHRANHEAVLRMLR